MIRESEDLPAGFATIFFSALPLDFKRRVVFSLVFSARGKLGILDRLVVRDFFFASAPASRHDSSRQHHNSVKIFEFYPREGSLF
jgi:hypothetical protein